MVTNLTRGQVPEFELLGGKPVDVHVLQDYLPEIDSYQIKTVIRSRIFRKMEELNRFTEVGHHKFNWGLIILILFIIGILALGIIIVMYYPQISAWFKGMFGGLTGGK